MLETQDHQIHQWYYLYLYANQRMRKLFLFATCLFHHVAITILCCYQLTRASIHGCMPTETTTPIVNHPPTHPHPILPTHPYPIPPTYPHPIQTHPPTPTLYHPSQPYTTHLPPPYTTNLPLL